MIHFHTELVLCGFFWPEGTIQAVHIHNEMKEARMDRCMIRMWWILKGLGIYQRGWASV